MESAFRWTCPLKSCNERSPLYGDEAQVKTECEAHIKKHSIDEALPFIMTGNWLTKFQLSEVSPLAKAMMEKA